MEVTEQDSTGVWLCALWFGLCALCDERIGRLESSRLCTMQSDSHAAFFADYAAKKRCAWRRTADGPVLEGRPPCRPLTMTRSTRRWTLRAWISSTDHGQRLL